MGSVRRRKNKEYYAVFRGRVNEPTIFSSWGDAHPRITGCPAVHEAFHTIEAARSYMMRKGISKPKEVIKSTADTTPERNSTAYYAIAHGTNPGIRRVWYGRTGTLEQIEEISGACHKRFRAEAQAEAFIEDWKESFADVWRMEVKKALDSGLRPRDMKLSVQGVLYEGSEHTITENVAKEFETKFGLDEDKGLSNLETKSTIIRNYDILSKQPTLNFAE